MNPNNVENSAIYKLVVKARGGKTREDLLKQAQEHLRAVADIHAQLEDNDGAQGGVPGGNTKPEPEKKKKDPPRSGEKAKARPIEDSPILQNATESQREILKILRGEAEKGQPVDAELEQHPILAIVRATRPAKARPYSTPAEKARFDAAVDAAVQKVVAVSKARRTYILDRDGNIVK